MSLTSINIQPVKESSESHNKREKPLDYVRQDLSTLNQSFEIDTISNRLVDIKARYQASTNQKLQKKATPIREGVIVIKEDTSIEHLKTFSRECENKFGIRAFQIFIHRDEGHIKDGEFKCNQHAHIVFDWTDATTGKSIKLQKQHMSEMQTILAECLQMERGKSSDKKHLSAIQFKVDQESENLKQLTDALQATYAIIEKQKEDIKHLRNEVTQLNVLKKAKSATLEVFSYVSDKLSTNKLKEANEALIFKNKAIMDEYKEVQTSLTNLLLAYDRQKIEHKKEVGKVKEELTTYKNEVKRLANNISPQVKETLRKTYPLLFTSETIINRNQNNSMKL